MEKEKFLKFLQKQLDEKNSIHFNMNKDLTEKRISNMIQRRSFFQHITILALGFSGVTFFTNKINNYYYFTFGIFLLIFDVILILLWLKEIIDIESIELEKLQDKYNNILDEQKILIDKYVESTLKEFKPDLIMQYFNNILSLPGFEIIQDDIKKESVNRKNRSKQILDYSGEIFIFILSSGIFFIFFSIFKFKIHFIILFLGFFVFFILIIQEAIVTKIMKKISKIITWFKKIKYY